MEQYIGGFQIAMQDVLGVERLEGVSELEKDDDGLGLAEPGLALDEFGEGAAVTKLVDEVVVVGSPQHLYKLDDVGVVDFGENGDFVVGEFAEFGRVLELLHVHHFDRVDVFVPAVLGPVDVPVLPLAHVLLQHVVFDHLVHPIKLLSYPAILLSYMPGYHTLQLILPLPLDLKFSLYF